MCEHHKPRTTSGRTPGRIPSCHPRPPVGPGPRTCRIAFGSNRRASPAAAARLTTFDTAQSNDSHHSKGLLLLWRNDQLPLTTLGRLAIQPNCQKATDGDTTLGPPVMAARSVASPSDLSARQGPRHAQTHVPARIPPEGGIRDRVRNPVNRDPTNPILKGSQRKPLLRWKGRADAVTDDPLRASGRE